MMNSINEYCCQCFGEPSSARNEDKGNEASDDKRYQMAPTSEQVIADRTASNIEANGAVEAAGEVEESSFLFQPNEHVSKSVSPPPPAEGSKMHNIVPRDTSQSLSPVRSTADHLTNTIIRKVSAPVPPSTKEGYMLKKGHINQAMRCRYFVLSEGVLRYYSVTESGMQIPGAAAVKSLFSSAAGVASAGSLSPKPCSSGAETPNQPPELPMPAEPPPGSSSLQLSQGSKSQAESATTEARQQAAAPVPLRVEFRGEVSLYHHKVSKFPGMGDLQIYLRSGDSYESTGAKDLLLDLDFTCHSLTAARKVELKNSWITAFNQHIKFASKQQAYQLQVEEDERLLHDKNKSVAAALGILAKQLAEEKRSATPKDSEGEPNGVVAAAPAPAVAVDQDARRSPQQHDSRPETPKVVVFNQPVDT